MKLMVNIMDNNQSMNGYQVLRLHVKQSRLMDVVHAIELAPKGDQSVVV